MRSPELAEFQSETHVSAIPSDSARRLDRRESRLQFIAVCVAFWCIYAATGCWKRTWYNAHVYLADSLLHGRFDLVNPPPHFEMVRLAGHYYIAYGIGPSLLMLPFVAVWGTQFHQALFSAAIAALAVALWWSTLGFLTASRPKRILLTALFGLGSLFWFYAGEKGDTWSLMHVTAVFGLMLAIHEVFVKARGWLVGLGFGIAVLSRQPTLMALPFFAAMLWRNDEESFLHRLRPEIFFALAFGALLAFNAFYNAARFGSLFDNGYERVILATTDQRFLPWGLFSFKYAPSNFATYFLRLPENLPSFPWYNPTMTGFSVFISTPALFLAIGADLRKRVNFFALAACVFTQLLYLIYYWSGFAQFGCRYSLDYLPFVMLLAVDGSGKRTPRSLLWITIFGALVEFWGITWWRHMGW
jgi:hypothetical protein